MTVLFAHVHTGRWVTVVADKLVAALAIGEPLRALDIIDAQQKQRIGLVLPQREPMTPLVHGLYAEARRIMLDSTLPSDEAKVDT
jgi:DNA-binding transcriptional LysR family regulator